MTDDIARKFVLFSIILLTIVVLLVVVPASLSEQAESAPTPDRVRYSLPPTPTAVSPVSIELIQTNDLTVLSTRTVLQAGSESAAFGYAVAVDGNTAVVGAPTDDGAREKSGAAYVFQFDGAAWQEIARLVAGDGAAHDGFGRSVAIDGDVIVVGANGNDETVFNGGAVYVFRRDGERWVQEAKITPGNALDAFFGWSVALSGPALIVGAPHTYRQGEIMNTGAVYFYTYQDAAWQETTRWATNNTSAAISDLYGWSVDVDGNTAVVGAPLADKVYVYQLQDGVWRQSSLLSNSDGERGNQFGFAVAVNDNYIAVGAPQTNSAGNNAGAVHLFEGRGVDWQEKMLFVPEEFSSGSRLGWSVDLAGTLIVAGAPESKGAMDQDEAGAAYVYSENGRDWDMISLYADESSPLNHFGAAVAITGEMVWVSAPDSSGGRGTVHLFTIE